MAYSPDILTVCCVKSKPLYDHHYVNKLQKAVRKHLSLPHRFVCLTDDSSGLKCRTKQLPRELKGWWAKLYLFNLHLEGKVLYLDLDTLVTDSLDFVGEYDGDFAILRDFYRPEGYGSGVMLWNETPSHVWDRWFDNPVIHTLGDQGWIEDQIPNADRLQDLYPGKFVSYKADCEKGLPEGASVLCFHGTPKPHDFDSTHWVGKIWNE
jgi:hypothetical protein